MKTRKSESDLRRGIKVEAVLPQMPLVQQLGQTVNPADKSQFARTGNLVIIDRNTRRS